MNNKDQSSLKEIDNYLSGRLSPENLQEFEKRISTEEELQKEIELTSQVIEGIEAHAFKAMLKTIHDEHFGKGS